MRHGIRKWVVMALAVLSTGLSACATGSSMGWKEEVQLHDGRVIIIERHFNLGGYPSLDSHNRSLLDESISFNLPDSNKMISWKTEFRNDLPEPNSLGLLLVDMVGGVPYIGTSPAGCISYNKWGRPNPPYVLFKYVDGEWKRISLEEFPAELVHANLMSKPDLRGLKSYYTIEQAKEQMQGRNVADYAKTILREPLANYDKSCPNLIRTGDGWKSRDWFENKPSREACLKFCDTEKVSVEACPCNSIFDWN